MIQAIINTAVTFIVSSVLGYCVSVIRNYKNKIKEKGDNEKIQNLALLTLLQSQLTNTYFVYNEVGKITDYVYQNWLNLFDIYKELGGNNYVDTLKSKMENWQIIKTDILQK